MSDNFNLKKFLTENKLTTNARVLNEVSEEGKKTVRLTADSLKYPFIDDTKHAILDKEYCDKIGITYNVGDGANIGGTVFKVIRVIEPYFYLLEKQNTQADLAEGTSASWKDLWDALQAALAKESDAEADNALKVIAKAAASKVGASVKGKLEKYNDSLNEGGNRERQVYDIVEDSVEKALSAIEQYKNTADTDQSGDLGIFHDVEVALEDVLDFLIYTQKPDVD